MGGGEKASSAIRRGRIGSGEENARWSWAGLCRENWIKQIERNGRYTFAVAKEPSADSPVEGAGTRFSTASERRLRPGLQAADRERLRDIHSNPPLGSQGMMKTVNMSGNRLLWAPPMPLAADGTEEFYRSPGETPYAIVAAKPEEEKEEEFEDEDSDEDERGQGGVEEFDDEE